MYNYLTKNRYNYYHIKKHSQMFQDIHTIYFGSFVSNRISRFCDDYETYTAQLQI